MSIPNDWLLDPFKLSGIHCVFLGDQVGGRPYLPGPGVAGVCLDCLLSPLADSTTMVLSAASSEAQVPLKLFFNLLDTH